MQAFNSSILFQSHCESPVIIEGSGGRNFRRLSRWRIHPYFFPFSTALFESQLECQCWVGHWSLAEAAVIPVAWTPWEMAVHVHSPPLQDWREFGSKLTAKKYKSVKTWCLMQKHSLTFTNKSNKCTKK